VPAGVLRVRSAPPARKVSCSYSFAGDLVGVTDATGASETLAYASHELTSVTDANGHANTYAYDAGGRVSSVADALSDTGSRGRRLVTI
jgi:YD repeat-containing protein